MLLSQSRKVEQKLDALIEAINNGFSGLHNNVTSPVVVAMEIPAVQDVNIKTAPCLEVCPGPDVRFPVEVHNYEVDSRVMPLGVYLAAST
jgi:hypothetical protein